MPLVNKRETRNGGNTNGKTLTIETNFFAELKPFLALTIGGLTFVWNSKPV